MDPRGHIRVDLPEDLAAWVEDLVRAGVFASSDDVVHEALSRFREAEEARKAAIEKLNADVAIGCEQIMRGEVVDGETAMRQLQEKISRYRAKSA